MWYHFVGSSPLRVPCTCCPKLERKRKVGRATLNPEKPPSPPPVCFHSRFEPVHATVQLSWVPPIATLRGRVGWSDSVGNWMVVSPAFRLVSSVGMDDKSCLHVLSCA